MADDDRSRFPQLTTPSDAVVMSVEWMFEPAWRGDRLVARVEDRRVSLFCRGEPADAAFAEAAEVIGPAVEADQAVLDGIWTNMPFVGEGSAARHLAAAIDEQGLGDELPNPIENEPRHAFVAIDLAELEGQSLHEVPYLERRRLLASVITESVRVRISPAVRLPLHNWLRAWRANGFERYVAKHVNSRYHPGEIAEDWLEISTAERRGPSQLGRLWGQRSKKTALIDDRRAAERG